MQRWLSELLDTTPPLVHWNTYPFVLEHSLRCNGGTGLLTGVGYQRLTAAEEASLVSELESQGSAVMREWSSLLGSAAAAAHATNSLHGSNESG